MPVPQQGRLVSSSCETRQTRRIDDSAHRCSLRGRRTLPRELFSGSLSAIAFWHLSGLYEAPREGHTQHLPLAPSCALSYNVHGLHQHCARPIQPDAIVNPCGSSTATAHRPVAETPQTAYATKRCRHQRRAMESICESVLQDRPCNDENTGRTPSLFRKICAFMREKGGFGNRNAQRFPVRPTPRRVHAIALWSG